MDSFNSTEYEHTFTLNDVITKQTARGDKSMKIIVDVPFTEELHGQLSHFIWKDVSIVIEKTNSKEKVEFEAYVEDVRPKDYKEGPRIRISIRQPFTASVYQKIGKILFHDINMALTILQPELPMEEGEE